MYGTRAVSDGDARRPRPLHSSKSFTRLEPTAQSPLGRSRASTFQGAISELPHADHITLSPGSEEKAAQRDIFVSKDEDDSEDEIFEDNAGSASKQLEAFEELPIEIRSLTERFLESLSAKVHPTPLSIDDLAEMFQEFYIRADSHISTHIAALSSRLSRSKSPSPSELSQMSKTPKGGRAASGTSRKGTDPELDGTEQQMLTASEIFDRKKARRLLAIRHVALEEAVERAVCEKVYDRIWRYCSTDDAERDEKLRSRTAALSLVGIGLKELVSTADDIPAEVRKATIEKEEDICNWLAGARESIRKMDDEKYPVGKLQHLTAAHKIIVETLSRLFPSSSSADEILPTLIYTLITSPPESLNVVSNLNFIQRFRASRKVDGEAAYCLVNLEAAISFLETVDLSSLRDDEAPSGPEKSNNSRPSTPRSHTAPTPMNLGLSSAVQPSVSPLSATSTSGDRSPSTSARPSASPFKPQRRISYLIQSQADRINEASGAVRASINDTADQALDSFNTTLETSFKFLFGRMSESPTKNGAAEIPVPRTLEDVRKLVGTPPPLPLDDDTGAPEGVPEQTDGALDSSPAAAPSRPEPKFTDLFAGRRDRSVDSTRSGGSGKRVSFAEGKSAAAPSSSPAPAPPTPSPSSAVPASASAGNALQNLGNTLNPLKGFGGLGGFPRFGRAQSATPPAVGGAGEKGKQLGHGEGKGGSPAGETKPLPSAGEAKEAVAVKALEELRKTGPPVKRFLEMKDAREMRIGEVEELLREYQRLAGALRAAIQS
ncbi:hypothetical protein H2201_006148 [Coniosporium apollinis]|uniref:VPS9 domain-containing protein n=1 Tax=Coniosporium apollinis TaxID=61459 RepID=A0ABQ9NMT5_9PEZI|nr:hypothetical protein H2201_006148 [Coniosporium apollinis]